VPNILCVDDHPIVREGLKLITSEADDLTISDEANNGFETLRKVRKKQFDAVILDISMPGADGLDVLFQLKKLKPDLPVLVLSMHSEKRYAIRALKAGASGYLTKEKAPEELVSSLRMILSGHKYISVSLAERLANRLAEKENNRSTYESLSDREYQVMLRIASGEGSCEISEQLCISPKTVNTYRQRIMEKLELKTNLEIMRYAIDNNLID
jgi:DNA-binding NarL/FixJ family response regulator